MAVLFQAVLMAVHLVGDVWGQSGVFTSAAVLGLTDVDALTVSMARGVATTASPAIAATAIAVGVLANTVMKLGLAVFLGGPRFRAIAGGALALMLVAVGGHFCFSPGEDSAERRKREAGRRQRFRRPLHNGGTSAAT
jgi:uncharacterized membrane protein (DUF4010 family)